MSTSPSVSNVSDGLPTAAAPIQSDSVASQRKSLKRALSLTNISVPDLSSKKPRGRKPKIMKDINNDNDGATCTTASLLKRSTDSSTQTTDAVFQCLHDEIRNLHEAVTALSAKVSELVSVPPVNFPAAQQSTVVEAHPTSYAAVVTDNSCHNQPMSSRSNNDSTRTIAKPRDLTNQDAVTAMYVDLRRKQQRSNNIVITGLQNSYNDAALVTKLLEEEFGCDTELWPGVSIARCQRLGKLQDNKLQPLLVTLDSRDQAEYYVKNARYLRNSNNQEVKRNVYINADLTPSEAKAAYELRMERKRKRSDQRDQTSTGDNLTRVYFRSKSARDIIDSQVSTAVSSRTPVKSTNVRDQSAIDSSPITLKWRPTALVEKSTQSLSALSTSDSAFVSTASNTSSSSSFTGNVCTNSQAAPGQQVASTSAKLPVKSVGSPAAPPTTSSLIASPTATSQQTQSGRPGCAN